MSTRPPAKAPCGSKRALIVLAMLCVALTACTPDRTAHMSCEDLRLDNVSMTDPMAPGPHRPYDITRVRENNQRVTELDCAWASDDHSGPA